MSYSYNKQKPLSSIEAIVVTVVIGTLCFALIHFINAKYATANKHRITAFSNGKEIGRWISKGRVSTYRGRCNFTDETTNQRIVVHGDYIIENITNDKSPAD